MNGVLAPTTLMSLAVVVVLRSMDPTGGAPALGLIRRKAMFNPIRNVAHASHVRLLNDVSRSVGTELVRDLQSGQYPAFYVDYPRGLAILVKEIQD